MRMSDWSSDVCSSDLPFDWYLLLLFGIGALVMRGAGCTFNDIVDRDFDGRVARTRLRPIPAGQVSVRQAWIWLVAQALVGLAILVQMNGLAILPGVASLGLVATRSEAPRGGKEGVST